MNDSERRRTTAYPISSTCDLRLSSMSRSESQPSRSDTVLSRLETWNETPEERIQFLLDDIKWMTDALKDEWDCVEIQAALEFIALREAELKGVRKQLGKPPRLKCGQRANETAGISSGTSPEGSEVSSNYYQENKIENKERSNSEGKLFPRTRQRNKRRPRKSRHPIPSFALRIWAVLGIFSFRCSVIRGNSRVGEQTTSMHNRVDSDRR